MTVAVHECSRWLGPGNSDIRLAPTLSSSFEPSTFGQMLGFESKDLNTRLFAEVNAPALVLWSSLRHQGQNTNECPLQLAFLLPACFGLTLIPGLRTKPPTVSSSWSVSFATLFISSLAHCTHFVTPLVLKRTFRYNNVTEQLPRNEEKRKRRRVLTTVSRAL